MAAFPHQRHGRRQVSATSKMEPITSSSLVQKVSLHKGPRFTLRHRWQHSRQNWKRCSNHIAHSGNPLCPHCLRFLSFSRDTVGDWQNHTKRQAAGSKTLFSYQVSKTFLTGAVIPNQRSVVKGSKYIPHPPKPLRSLALGILRPHQQRAMIVY